MPGLDIEALKQSADAYHKMEGSYLVHYERCQVQALQHLEDLAALNDLDKAAVAFYISRLFQALRNEHLSDISQTLVNTGVGYTLAAARLVGLDSEADHV